MYSQHQQLSDRQFNSFISFLIDGTDKAIIALEEVFGLDVNSSDSDLELAPVNESRFLRNLGDETVYTICSEMSGDLNGDIVLMLRDTDYHYLGDVMGPMLSLMFMANSDNDLESLEQEKPDWMQSDVCPMPQDETFQKQMRDLLEELGNVLMGRYSKALYQIFHLTMHHTIPTVRPVPKQELTGQLVERVGGDALHIVIENQFLVDDHPIKIWCMISPTRQGLSQLLGLTHH